MQDDVESSADTDDDDRSVLEEAVAELLSQLSERSDRPTGVTAPSTDFDFRDVDFSSSDWMGRLASVQGWLRLPVELLLDDPDQFASQLASALGFETPTEALAGQRLTTLGLDRLRERAEQAVRIRRVFIDELDGEGGTIARATALWVQEWEDEPDDADTSVGPVSAEAAIWPINEFTTRAADGELNLSPSYQRGDVWPTSDSQMLIESILRGIPLPSVIVLKRSDQPTSPYEVVDGKQRLTAILRFIGQHPDARATVEEVERKNPESNLLHHFDTNYPKFRRLWKTCTSEPLTASLEKELYFPFKLRADAPPLRGDLEVLQGRYYSDIKKERVRIADTEIPVKDLFERVTKYKIPVIEYSKATPRQIHEVFNLYNRQGKKLNAEEIRNALFHELDLMRGLIVMAGDNPHVTEVAPFLEDMSRETRVTPKLLSKYSFGLGRYKRTKILSWLSAMLLLDSMENGRPKKLSTSRQIDALLERVQGDASDPLREVERLRDAFGLLATGIAAHSAVIEAWAPKFRDNASGEKWQELQLVGSILGTTICAAVDANVVERLEQARPTLREQTATPAWRRPGNAQTATQWRYIAQTSLRVVEELGVDPDIAAAELERRFGFSGIGTLRAVARES